MSTAALRVENLTKAFGGLTAVNGVSFEVEAGKVTGLIGPNGSGKTTAFNLITGVLAPDRGQVYLGDLAVGGWAPHRMAQRGMARTFQISRIFGQLTVWDNLMVVARQRSDREARELATSLLQRVNLLGHRDHYGADLSYGQQKLLEFVRALMLEPTVVLLDEPFAGVNPTMRNTMLDLIDGLQQEGKTIFLVDHAMAIIMTLCDRLLVMDMGELIAQGPPAEIQENEQVLDAYFGRRSAPSPAEGPDAPLPSTDRTGPKNSSGEGIESPPSTGEGSGYAPPLGKG
jgi:branched-chain amino acid transport system ATP-binding protein